MQKKILSFFAILALFSCQNEGTKIESTIADEASFTALKKDWINSSLNYSLSKFDGNTTCYLFSKNDVKCLLSNSQLKKVRFVLGLTDGKLDLKIQGVDIKGEGLGVINSMIHSDQKITGQINELSLS